jgi:hypothetical protein
MMEVNLEVSASEEVRDVNQLGGAQLRGFEAAGTFADFAD